MRIRYISILLASGLLAGSCSTKWSLQKRRYGKGFYIASNHGSSQPTGNSAQKQSTSKAAAVGDENTTVEVVNAVPEKVITPTQKDLASDLRQVYPSRRPVSGTNAQLSEQNQQSTSKTTKELKFTQQKKSFKKRDNLGDVLYSAYIGYYVVCLILAIILLYTEVGLAATLLIIGITLAIFLVCYAIGSFFRGLFN